MSDLVIRDNKNIEEKQYIVFTVDNKVYGIDIMHISTIIMMPEITEMPLSADYIRGVINLRGHVIPIISMHKRMNYGEETITKDTRVIVFNINENEQVGIIVDTVREVTVISSEEIENPSPFVNSRDTFISGVGKKDEELISILDVNTIVDTEIVLDEKIA
ncbi:purine-binding chemotaxis protein CheW [Pseudobutyrivibrio sp. UC1225]|uniref:chemotaxis protein CheW n=1 Tax=Pseudobutyrivibrio sp. UC1225 TaxID=1798185 RepID=UPI0008DF62D0|nr:chemotaxis protein CheW [Pseudobutyrivibrio sp. UC1225]SFO23369.1 purine-binding chemotaxis protein CheW [Pseudobutyrivibrio sp. UC1225]